MSAQGYIDSPLSDEMVKRIKERIQHARIGGSYEIVSALEWVLNEAEALKSETRVQSPRDHTCPDCGHLHEARDECKVYLGEGRFCPCESKVTA